MSKVALIVMDIQEGLVALRPYQFGDMWVKVEKLISAARNASNFIVFIQHTEDEGLLVPYSPTWKLYFPIQVLANEAVIAKTENNSFLGTTLKKQLLEHGITDIVVVGLQTEVSIQATVKAANKLGFKVWVSKDTNSTYDNEIFKAEEIISQYNDGVFLKKQINVVSFENLLELLTQ